MTLRVSEIEGHEGGRFPVVLMLFEDGGCVGEYAARDKGDHIERLTRGPIFGIPWSYMRVSRYDRGAGNLLSYDTVLI